MRVTDTVNKFFLECTSQIVWIDFFMIERDSNLGLVEGSTQSAVNRLRSPRESANSVQTLRFPTLGGRDRN